MKIIQKSSPNFGERRDGAKPSLIVLHYTDMKTAAESLGLLLDPAREASAHYLIDTNGDIYQMVNEGKRAWHAGKSFWRGITDVNSHSIGIEIQNPGHQFGYVPFPDAQMKAVADLCRDIMARHDIPAANVIGHSDIAPQRKKDPGELFPWAWLAEQGVGVFPPDNPAAAPLENLSVLFEAAGYDPGVPLSILVESFQRHFEQDIFKTPEKAGIPTPLTAARLQWLAQRRAFPLS